MQGRFYTKPTRCYRSVFLSRCLLGTHHAHYNALLDTLASLECDTLFLVGDIIDATHLKRAWTWQPIHTHIMNALAHLSYKGTKIIYIPGDHDQDIAAIFPRLLKWVARRNKFTFKRTHIHTLADGRQMEIRYGRMFRTPKPDIKAPLLKRALHQFETRIIKRKNYNIMHYAQSRDLDGVITAQPIDKHIHHHDGITFADTGVCDKNALTFLAEGYDGSLAHVSAFNLCPETLTLPTMNQHLNSPDIAMTDDLQHYNAITHPFIQHMKMAWCPRTHSAAMDFASTWPKHRIWGRVNSV